MSLTYSNIGRRRVAPCFASISNLKAKHSRLPKPSTAVLSGDAACRSRRPTTGLFQLGCRSLKFLRPNPKLLFRNIGAGTQDHLPHSRSERQQKVSVH